MTKEERKEYCKNYYKNNKEKCIKQKKNYYKTHDKKIDKSKIHEWYLKNKEKCYAYKKADLNSLGQMKSSIRLKSLSILKQMNLNIPGYEIHHCFGYEDPSKFIYISKSLHLKIHVYLREHNIDAGKDHWMAIRDIVNSTDEFTFIKC